MIVDLDYWRKEFCSFREIMSSSKYTVEDVDNAFNGLVKVWVELCKNLDISEQEKKDATTCLEATGLEKNMRADLRLLHGI